MRRFKDIFGRKSRPTSDPANSPAGEDATHSNAAPQAPRQGQSASSPAALNTTAFKALVERSIAALSSMTYVGDLNLKVSSLQMISSALRSCNSIEDLSKPGSAVTFWFFQRREPFLKQKAFQKWDPRRLDDYVLLPVAQGFVNKLDCYFVSHYWRTKHHPDPKGTDYRLVRGDLANSSWSYVWIDWTCLPQAPRTAAEEAYFTKILPHASLLPRDCAFEWRYPDFKPRLWILVELASYMLTSNDFTTTPDSKPFIDDVSKMLKEGTLHMIRDRDYKCSDPRDFRLLVGWLELMVIMAKLIPDVSQRRIRLETVEMPVAGTWIDDTTGITVEKSLGLVSHKKSVYRFAPLYPIDVNTRLPPVLPEPGYCQLPACIDEIVEIMQRPELTEARRQLKEHEDAFGKEDPDAILAAGKLADVFADLKQYTEAEVLYRRVAENLEKRMGPTHSQTLATMKKWDDMLFKLERYKELEQLRRRVLEIYQNWLGPPNSSTLDAMNMLGASLHMQKRYDEADVYFQKYLKG